ncbi:MAG: methylmalonyl Co-A mutase-associated GTPase MeaB [Chloroflexi bacterium]|nr:methylmalonyl Co-A mutase-associated GTPase MeaB [Chloroflexota bacterium]
MEIVDRIRSGDRRALARLISRIENGAPEARDALIELYRHTGRAWIIGLTGAPGTGKSTLARALALEERRRGRTVGVIAVDPTSPFTGGAVLGDRVRMQDLTGDPGVFVRSMATRGAMGGLAPTTIGVAEVLDAAGFDVILVETVGVGQDEVDIARAAHTTVVVQVPGLGDDIQAIKAGLLEIADIYVVNKADREGADRLVSELAAMLSLAPDRGRRPPILRTVARDEMGIAELADAVEAHRRQLERTGRLVEELGKRIRQEILMLAESDLAARLHRRVGNGRLDGLVADVAARRLDPYTAARLLAEEVCEPA